MSNQTPFPPLVPGGEDAPQQAPDAVTEVDGEDVLDPDIAGDQVNSAEADRLATQDSDD